MSQPEQHDDNDARHSLSKLNGPLSPLLLFQSRFTGRLCVRSGTCGTGLGGVFSNKPVGGLPQSETTFAAQLKAVGYTTAAMGKHRAELVVSCVRAFGCTGVCVCACDCSRVFACTCGYARACLYIQWCTFLTPPPLHPPLTKRKMAFGHQGRVHAHGARI